MLKSSLLEILRTFSKQELVKFEDFVRSPYFNKKENVVKLFLEIKEYGPDFNNDNLEKEKIWNKIFSGKEYNYGIFKNLVFDLNKLAERFIIDLKFNKDEYNQNEYFVSALLDRELHKMFLSKYNLMNKELDLSYLNSNNTDFTTYLDHTIEMNEIKIKYHQQFDHNYRFEDLHSDSVSYRITTFLITLFNGYLFSLSISQSKNHDMNTALTSKFLELISPGLEKLIESINKGSKLNSRLINIYYSMYLSLKEKNEKRYLEFKKILSENADSIPKYDLQLLVYGLMSHFLKENYLELNPHKEVVESYDLLIENNIMTDLKYDIIPIYQFNSYVFKCFLLSDSNKIKKFASGFIKKLDPKYIETSSIYVKSLISFLDKDFKDSLNCISVLDIPYSFHKLPLKFQKAMCLYEIGDYEMFLNELDNLKHFTNNNKFVNDSQISKLKNYFYVIKCLFNLKQEFDKYEYLKLKDFIKQTYKYSNSWFNEKIEEIEKTNRIVNS